MKDRQHGRRKLCMINSREVMQDQRMRQWLKAGELKQETESLICAAQEQACRTDAVKNGIDHKNVSLLCSRCKEKVESVTHIVILSSVLAGNQYRKRDDKLGKKSILAPIQEHIIDIAVPQDQNIKVKELEKISKCQDLQLQAQKLRDVKATVIPIVVGALGTVSEELENHLKTIGIPIRLFNEYFACSQ